MTTGTAFAKARLMISRRESDLRIDRVAESITRYLESHPNAVDNLNGIVHWWLLKQKIEDSTEVVQAAIDSLVSEGVVQKIERNGKVFYSSSRQAGTYGSDDEIT